MKSIMIIKYLVLCCIMLVMCSTENQPVVNSQENPNSQQPNGGDENDEDEFYAYSQADAIITYPARLNPILWGYDAKEPNSATRLTLNLARSVFEDDGMSILRVPIFLNYYNENDRTVIEDHPAVVRAMNAVRNAMQAKPDVEIFASLKIEGVNGVGVEGREGTFPDWAYNSAPNPRDNQRHGFLKPDVYIDMLANFLIYMKNNNVPVHYLAIDNEPEHSCSGFDRNFDLYIEVLDGLRAKAETMGFEMPPKLVAPEPLGPKEEHINFLTYIIDTKDRGDLIDIVGTHYYPTFRWNNANLQSRLRRIADAGKGRPLWNTEAHYDALDQIKKADNWTELDRANQFMVTNFDCFDLGCNGYFMWAYRRNDTESKGSVSRELAQSTAGATHVPVNINADGKNAVDLGFNVRAFVKDKRVTVWITNMKDVEDTRNFTKEYTLAVRGRTITNDHKYLVWTDQSWASSPFSASTNDSPAVSACSNYISFTIPDRSMSLLIFNLN